MTTNDTSSTDRIVRPRNRNSTEGGYRWTCPFCGKTQTNTSNGESGERNAVAALRTHIIASDGGDHGPRNDYPDGLDAAALSDHVIEVIGRE